MGIKEKFSAGLKTIQEETQKQFEKTKEAINNYKPHQLEKKITDCKKDIEKYQNLLDELEVKKKEYEFKKSLAQQEMKLAEEKLKLYNK